MTDVATRDTEPNQPATSRRGLAQLMHHAQLELEMVTITAKEASRHG